MARTQRSRDDYAVKVRALTLARREHAIPKYLRETAKIYAVKLPYRSVPKSRAVTDLFTGICRRLRKSALAIRLLSRGQLADSRVIRGA
jgi:hypothetical protein